LVRVGAVLYCGQHGQLPQLLQLLLQLLKTLQLLCICYDCMLKKRGLFDFYAGFQDESCNPVRHLTARQATLMLSHTNVTTSLLFLRHLFLRYQIIFRYN
jgi:hypothetical protein